MPRFKNPAYVPIQEVRARFLERVAKIESIEEQCQTPWVNQVEHALLGMADNVTGKVLHPIFMQGYKMPTPRYRKEPIELVGMDIETNAANGSPKLVGMFYAPNAYNYTVNPSLVWLYKAVCQLRDKTKAHLAVWGTLDIQCIIRLFEPDELERKRISRGISANVKDGMFKGEPPILRSIPNDEGNNSWFYISAYIPGRALKLGVLTDGGREEVTWIFNMHQFYPTTIEKSSKALGLPWINFPKDTHIIDWERFQTDNTYRLSVIASNEQDTRNVYSLGIALQKQFFDTFDAYPSLLVSTGSICDAAVARLLDTYDYASNNMEYLIQNVWEANSDPKACEEIRILAAECFSAGYVDQFAVGYFGGTSQQVWTADIASAYPAIIRTLPDLRKCRLIYGKGDPEKFVEERRKQNNSFLDIETIFIRGTVRIPAHLKYHPITVKTYKRENVRPIGNFCAAYIREERQFCIDHGATFEDEEFVILDVLERTPAPLAEVSIQLGKMRDALRKKMRESTNGDKAFLDGQQYLVKVIDNSLYGKTVMTTEIVENDAQTGVPAIVGYMPGDRYNPIYGDIITGRTRTYLARACMAIVAGGGRPIMTMTDSVYWQGTANNLPEQMIRTEKTAGYFEPPETVEEFFLLKTGQYEFKKLTADIDNNRWQYKLRGLPIQFEILKGRESFYRSLIKEHTANSPHNTAAQDVEIPIPTRRLMSIGAVHPDTMDLLGGIIEGTTTLKPFVFSSKQTERTVKDWRKALDAPVWLADVRIQYRENPAKTTPMKFLNDMYRDEITKRGEHLRSIDSRAQSREEARKKAYVLRATESTKKPPPSGRVYKLGWQQLENYYGVERIKDGK